MTEFTTEQLIVKATQRFSFGYTDPRAVYGSERKPAFYTASWHAAYKRALDQASGDRYVAKMKMAGKW